MPIPLLDVINNIPMSGWGIVFGSFFTAALAGVIFWQDVSRRSNKFFLLFGIINVIWGLVYAFFEGTFDTPAVQLGMVLLYISAAGTTIFFYFFLYSFANEKNEISLRKFLLILSPYFLIIGILLISPNLIVIYEASTTETQGKIVFGKAFLIYVVYILGYLGAGVFVIAKKYRESAGIFKTAMREMLIAICFACGIAVLMALFSPFIGGGHDLFWVGHLSIILLIIATGIILARFNFWSIKIIATELFISIIILLFLLELFIAVSIFELIIKVSITLLIVLSGFFLVGSVKREIQSKDKIEKFLKMLDEMNARLKVLDRKKSEFLSVASHHLRDPLTAIRGYASMLSEGSFGDISRPVYEAIERIFESSGRLITMIDDFMDISRIESGDMKYVFTDVDLKKLVLDVSTEMKHHADRVHLALGVSVGDEKVFGERFVTVGDEGKLRQVFSNVIDNSIKYTPQGEISVKLVKSPDKKKILFSVIDTGIGMNELTKEKIFRKFSRAEDVNKVYTEGTGLGLYVAKEIVEKHEGRIWAESDGEGRGSRFFVELEAKR